MANDIIDINVFETVETVAITVNPNLTTVNINQITGGGGGGGVTNLSTTQTDINFTINSDTGNDAIVPLGNGILAGATLNDYTTPEKTKLNGISEGAEVNVNADWDATTGDAQILNKPIIPSITNLVPYTGATSDVNLGEYGIQLGNLEFDNTPTNIPTATGSIYYNDTDGTLDLILKGGNVKLQIGQESVVRVVNKTATNITLLEANYQAVRVTGAQGQRMKVDLAQATTDGLSAETIGLVTETILNNQEGFVTTSGLVRNIDTTGSLQSETWLDGDVLYLSPTVAGSITKVKPTAPNHLIVIGYVIHAHATQGTIFVKVDNGYELEELHNVAINGKLNEDFLQYESVTQLWKNKPLTDTLIKLKLGVTTLSGSNTGDNATNTQYSGLATSKQDTLQNTVNIKSINGNSILGSGDLTISATAAAQSPFTILANNSDVSAIPAQQVYKDIAEQTYGLSPSWAGTAPTTIVANTYQWQQVGSLVTVRVNLIYSTAGSITQAIIPLPTDMPTPFVTGALNNASDILYYGVGMFNALSTSVATVGRVCFLRRNAANNGYEFVIVHSSAVSSRVISLTLQYFT